MLPVYHASGFEVVDSIKVDEAGNVYLCIMFGGRLILFDPAGIAVANVLLSDHDQGTCAQSPNMALHPTKNEGYIVANGTDGAWVYRFEAPHPSARLYAYR